MYSLCFLVWGFGVFFSHLSNYRGESQLCVPWKRGGQHLINLVAVFAGSQLRWAALPCPLLLACCDHMLQALFPPFLHFLVGSIALNIRIPSSLILRSSIFTEILIFISFLDFMSPMCQCFPN